MCPHYVVVIDFTKGTDAKLVFLADYLLSNRTVFAAFAQLSACTEVTF